MLPKSFTVTIIGHQHALLRIVESFFIHFLGLKLFDWMKNQAYAHRELICFNNIYQIIVTNSLAWNRAINVRFNLKLFFVLIYKTYKFLSVNYQQWSRLFWTNWLIFHRSFLIRELIAPRPTKSDYRIQCSRNYQIKFCKHIYCII